MSTHAAEIARIVEIERAAGREPHPLVLEIHAAMATPDVNLRALADRLCDAMLAIERSHVRAGTLAMLAVYAARAEHFVRAGKAVPAASARADADSAIRRYARQSAF